MMRLLMFAAAAAMLAGPAAAQGSTGFAVGDLHYGHQVLQKRAQMTSALESPGSPLKHLSKATRAWIREETKRQGASPRPLLDVFMDVDAHVAEDARDLLRRHRIDPMDVNRIVTLLIMADAEGLAERDVKRARNAGDAAALSAAEARLAQATANRKEAGAMQTQVSMALAMM